MSLSTEDAVTETLRVALEQHLTSQLKTDQEWARFLEIARETATRINAEKKAFQTDYTKRLATARGVILREQNGHILSPPKPDWAVDKPLSAERIDLMARNRVQRDHDARIAEIHVDQMNDYQELRTQVKARAAREAHARNRRQGHAKDAMTTANQLSPHEAQSRTPSGPTRT